MGRTKNFSREGVLDKAIPVFWRQGFANANLQDLEKSTGVNKSGLYSEFKDKDDLFVACLERYTSESRTVRTLSAQPQGWGNVEQLLKNALAWPDGKKGCFLVNSMRELAVLPAQANTVINAAVARRRRLLEENIRAEGKSAALAGVIAEMVSTFFSGLCIEQNLAADKAVAEKKIRKLMELIQSL